MEQLVSSAEDGIVNFLINYASCQPRESWAGFNQNDNSEVRIHLICRLRRTHRRHVLEERQLCLLNVAHSLAPCVLWVKWKTEGNKTPLNRARSS